MKYGTRVPMRVEGVVMLEKPSIEITKCLAHTASLKTIATYPLNPPATFTFANESFRLNLYEAICE